jgi:hypothetical protein
MARLKNEKKTERLHSNNHLSCHSFHIKIGKTFLKRFWVFVADGVVERLKGFILGNHPSVISHLYLV